MRKLIATCLLLSSVSFVNNVIADRPATREVTIAVHDVFVPEVIDRNSDAKVVVSGMFPNSCYRWSRAEVGNRDQMFHEIQAKAIVTINTMCLMVLVPYTKEVNLGRLVT